MQNKCKHDTMYMILYHARSGVKKSKIKKKTLQNSSDLKKFLDYLHEIKMIDYDQQKETYKTTDAGMEFMYSYKQMIETLPYKENRVFAIQNSILGG